jgi:MarR family transcriptional regulator for hemolysin
METLNSIFFYNLDKAIKSYRQFAQAKLKQNGHDITVDQWIVLRSIVDKGDISQNELAEIVFKDKASVTRIIVSLIRKKYLMKNAHPKSNRRNLLLPTSRGKKLLIDIRPHVLQNRKKALEHISSKELIVAERVLKRIASNCKKELP